MGNQCEGFSSSAVNKQPQRTEGEKKRFPKLQGNISIKNTQRRSRERPQPEAGVEK